jgi:hypothetical protein
MGWEEKGSKEPNCSLLLYERSFFYVPESRDARNGESIRPGTANFVCRRKKIDPGESRQRHAGVAAA